MAVAAEAEASGPASALLWLLAPLALVVALWLLAILIAGLCVRLGELLAAPSIQLR